jgi:hypothetical protein
MLKTIGQDEMLPPHARVWAVFISAWEPKIKGDGVPDLYHYNRVFGTGTVYGILSVAQVAIS